MLNETLRDQPRNLYIEDSIEETKTFTGNISAEYGRFSGGVVNMITKSGGNTLQRLVPHHLRERQLALAHALRGDAGRGPARHQVVPTYEVTFGGPILKDRLWFFGAGRFVENNTADPALHRDPLHADDQGPALSRAS